MLKVEDLQVGDCLVFEDMDDSALSMEKIYVISDQFVYAHSYRAPLDAYCYDMDELNGTVDHCYRLIMVRRNDETIWKREE